MLISFKSLLYSLYCRLIAILANFWFRFPGSKLTLIAVVGANGQTETINFLRSIIAQTERKVGTITLEGVRAGGDKLAPEQFNINKASAFRVQKCVRELVSRGCEYGILEVGSDALKKKAACGCRFKVSALTNTDWGADMNASGNELYMHWLSAALSSAPWVVLNKDDSSYPYLARRLRGQRLTYAVDNEAQIKALKVQTGPWGYFFYFINKESLWKSQLSFDRSIKLKNQSADIIPSALAAIAAAAALNIPEFRIKKGLEGTKI